MLQSLMGQLMNMSSGLSVFGFFCICIPLHSKYELKVKSIQQSTTEKIAK